MIALRNLYYVFFITLFSLVSFTHEQLDLVSLVISTVILFAFILKEDFTYSKKDESTDKL